MLENRSSELFAAGANETEAAQAAAESAAADLMHHGLVRGVEVVLSDITVSGTGSSRTITANAGISDSHARLSVTLSATIIIA